MRRGRSHRSQADRAFSPAAAQSVLTVNFAGWKRLAGSDQLYGVPDWYERPPTSAPTTWLLAVGWTKHGLVGEHEVPGPQGSI